MEELNKIVERLYTIGNTYGIIAMVLVIIFVVSIFVGYKYIGKAAEVAAEEASEKNLKKFQSHIDKELIKFQTKHSKQVDAVHEVYQKFQKLTGMINYLIKGEKFTSPMTPKEEMTHLINFRHSFKNVYKENRLLFQKDLCNKIDELTITVDKWIETYSDGLFPDVEPEDSGQEQEGGTYLAGVWSMHAFDGIEDKLEQIREEIEDEFRKIYGTNE